MFRQNLGHFEPFPFVVQMLSLCVLAYRILPCGTQVHKVTTSELQMEMAQNDRGFALLTATQEPHRTKTQRRCGVMRFRTILAVRGAV